MTARTTATRGGAPASAVALALAIAACGGDERPVAGGPAPVPAPPADALGESRDVGPATVAWKVWPAQPTLGDSIWLRLEVTPDAGVTAELPFDQLALGRFEVLRYAPERAGGALVDTYELAAPTSGRHRLPPMRVVVRPPDGAPVEVMTDEVPLTVASVLAERVDAELAPARGALPERVGGGPRWELIGLAGGGALAAGAALLVARLRRRAARRARASAWELAMGRLGALQARGAPAPDEADPWFVELSAVVRGYLEGRFALRAPELTTEELLAEARRSDALTPAHRDRLGAFLELCDRVKFAGWRPDAGESAASLEVARQFVVETRPAEGAS